MHHDSCRQKASYDGSTIIARDDDSGSGRYDPKRFVAIAPEVSTDNLYWTNRLIAALADAHFYETSNAIEAFAEAARTYSHRLVEHTDAALRNIGKNSDDSAIGDSVAETAGGADCRAAAGGQRRDGGILAYACHETAQRRAVHVQQSYAQRFRDVGSLELSPPYGASAPVSADSVESDDVFRHEIAVANHEPTD